MSRHSSRKLPLKESMKRIVGWLAGAGVVNGDAVVVCPAIHGERDELAAVVGLDALWQVALMAEPLHHVLALELLVHLDCKALLGEIVDDGQRAKRRPSNSASDTKSMFQH